MEEHKNNTYILRIAIACESIEEGPHTNEARIPNPKTRDDVEVLQSAETIDKALILKRLKYWRKHHSYKMIKI